MLGPFDVNYQDWGSSDIYYKGSWMLHTLRQGMCNDSLWFGVLRSMVDDLGNQVVSTQRVIDYFNEKSGTDWTGFFEQYLQFATLPVLQWKKGEGDLLMLRWSADAAGFSLPVLWESGNGWHRADPSTGQWLEIEDNTWTDETARDVERRYLIRVEEVK